MSDNGITLENRIELRCGETRGRVFCAVMFFALTAFGAGAFAVCMRECLVPEANIKTVMAAVLATSAILTAGWALPLRGGFTVLAALLLFSVTYALNMSAVNAGLKLMYARELLGLKESYSLSIATETVGPAPKEATAALVFLSLAAAFATFLAIRFYRLSVLATLVPLIPLVCCIVAGRVPGALPLVALTAFFAAVNTQNPDLQAFPGSGDSRAGRRYREHTDLIRFSNAAICLVLIGVSMLIASLFANEQQYRDSGAVARLRNDLQQKILEIAHGEGEDKPAEENAEAGRVARAGLSNGKLDVADRVTYSDEELFEVYLQPAGPVYLRTYAGESYTGKSWENTDSDPEEALDVPGGIADMIASTRELQGLWGKDTFAVISGVREYLSKLAAYSLEPGRAPAGKDYIEFFLTEGKRGYCAHFASAAVMIFREFGIPARYAEGYRVVTGEGKDAVTLDAETVFGSSSVQTEEAGLKRFRVMDRNAHAWAEIYEDGIGWYAAEVTPGYFESTASGTATGVQGGSAGNPGTEPEGGGQTPSDPAGAASGQEKKEEASKDDRQREVKDGSNARTGVRVIFTIAVVLAVAFAVWRLSSRRRRGNLTIRESVLEDFATIAELTLKMTGVDILDGGEAIEKAACELGEKYDIQGLDGIFDTALRARFARECGRSDAARMRAFKRKLIERFLAEKKGPSKLINRMKYGK